MRILIVEDEKRLAETLVDIVTQSRNMADVCNDGISGLDNAMTGIYDAVILDVMLPGMDGFEIIKQMRKSGNTTPVLMLTAKTSLSDRVNGLNFGADYYLTKPFESAELIACLNTITRRGTDIKPDNPVFEDITLNIASYELVCNNRAVRLSAKESELIRLLIANKGILLSKETIYLKIWGYDGQAGDTIVEAYISFLRKKLEHIGSKVKISVVRRLGYQLEIDK